MEATEDEAVLAAKPRYSDQILEVTSWVGLFTYFRIGRQRRTISLDTTYWEPGAGVRFGRGYAGGRP